MSNQQLQKTRGGKFAAEKLSGQINLRTPKQ